jgi:hypothetical protein
MWIADQLAAAGNSPGIETGLYGLRCVGLDGQWSVKR